LPLTAAQPVAVVALSGVYASASAHGWLSPDVGQTEAWTRARQALRPFLPASKRQLLNLRFLSHWWGLSVLGAVGVPSLPAEFSWSAMMLVFGWASHLIGDFLFARRLERRDPAAAMGPACGPAPRHGRVLGDGRGPVSSVADPVRATQVVIGLDIYFSLLRGVVS
jgi:hypothetical protein